MSNSMSWAPDACTLPTEQIPLRVAEFTDLFARTLDSLSRPEPTRLRLGLADAAMIEGRRG